LNTLESSDRADYDLLMQTVTVVGAGLAGSEAALSLSARGLRVELFEMKPAKRTPAQTSDSFCELVCSNSFRGAAITNAVGLLKEELRRVGSIVMQIADHHQVPAGGAFAVDRDRFSAAVTERLRADPHITIRGDEVRAIPEARPVILATGPLTSDDLAQDLVRVVGSDSLAYYDAIAPIVAADSILWDRVWKQSRWGKAANTEARTDREADETGDEAYVNCPFDEAQYKAFVAALVGSEKVVARSFEDVRYFEGCLPCEVMAERGEQTLAYGPMKPVGLTDPRTGRRPYAVLQLRPEDEARTAYNLVGFQTRMKYAEQLRVFRMIPGLEEAEFLRMGSVHRNTFVDAPTALDETLQLKAAPGVFLAGQITGVEGYVESMASGFLCAALLAARLAGEPPPLPPPTTAFGALLTHLSRPGASGKYQPSNVTWAQVPPLPAELGRLKKRDRYEKLAQRAVADLGPWAERVSLSG
jgi:methylenetetrahydrofolate--tRNA-(uracil-5-)-methyltransferase